MTNPLGPLTIRGKCLLTAGIATACCAVILDERDLLRIATFVILLPLSVLLSVARGKNRVSARRIMRPERLTTGDEGEIALVLSRTGKLPAGGLLLDDTTTDLPAAPARFVVGRVPADHDVTVRYTIRPTHRGHYRIGPLHTTLIGPFGLTEAHRVLCGHSNILVVPRTYPLHGMPWPADGTNSDGDASRQRTGQGRPDMIVRQYHHGDDPRKVHWPSTARNDEIMLRADERTTSDTTTVLLDRRTTSRDSATSEMHLEWAVSFVASVALHLNAAGKAVRVVTERGDTLADLAGNAGAGRIAALLETLATVRSARQHTVTTLERLGDGNRMIAVLGVPDIDTADQLARERPRARQAFAVLSAGAATSATDRAGNTDRCTGSLHAAGWHTAVTTPRSTIAAVWERLCATDSGLEQCSVAAGDGA